VIFLIHEHTSGVHRVTAFYVAIFAAFTPRYLEMFKPILRLL
jgi:hypothetical protein